ncbi:hypothetical protein [Vreelandella nanhaiensis]|uniref:hypothetical protein n=1 Tax=Vreelandella nanhaiensis TaxID=1258546 RepID=UPI001C9E44A4|nr:hypothetical protein [Halomonas nanhaiensis]
MTCVQLGRRGHLPRCGVAARYYFSGHTIVPGTSGSVIGVAHSQRSLVRLGLDLAGLAPLSGAGRLPGLTPTRRPPDHHHNAGAPR